jgi:hypothetical protein
MIQCIRAKLLQIEGKMDAGVFSPSDYCIMGNNMYFEDYHPREIERVTRLVLMKRYDLKKHDIIYVNPCYDIGDFKALNKKMSDLNSKKKKIEDFLQN